MMQNDIDDEATLRQLQNAREQWEGVQHVKVADRAKISWAISGPLKKISGEGYWLQAWVWVDDSEEED